MKYSTSIIVGLVFLTLLSSCTFSDTADTIQTRSTASESSGSLVAMERGHRERPARGIPPIADTREKVATSTGETRESPVVSDVESTVTPISTPVVPVTQISASSPTVSDTSSTVSRSISYRTPSREGSTTTKFSITLSDGVITAASAVYVSGDHEDQRYQSRFSQSIASVVVGKKLSDISLDVVGGASLTTDAFEAFIQSV